MEHLYIDGTKLPANANKYSWVWKKSSEKNRQKTFGKVTALLGEMNETMLPFGVKFGTREEYAIPYPELIQEQYVKTIGLDPEKTVRGRGHRKTVEQRLYDKLSEYIEILKKYAENIKICGEKSYSYSMTDNDATFIG